MTATEVDIRGGWPSRYQPAPDNLGLAARAATIEQHTMPHRRVLVAQATEAVHTHVPGLTPWAAIDSTLRFFHSQGWDERGGWISIVDSCVLEALTRGVCQVLYGETDDYRNPGADIWAQYLSRLLDDPAWPHADREGHDRLWARAEHVATEHGKYQADRVHAPRDEVQYRWYLLSAYYRSLMHDPPTLTLARAVRSPVMAWFTDVTRPEPVLHGAHLAHGIAALSPTTMARAAYRVGSSYLSRRSARTTVR